MINVQAPNDQLRPKNVNTQKAPRRCLNPQPRAAALHAGQEISLARDGGLGRDQTLVWFEFALPDFPVAMQSRAKVGGLFEQEAVAEFEGVRAQLFLAGVKERQELIQL